MAKAMTLPTYRTAQFIPILLASISCSALEPQLTLRIHILKEFTDVIAQTPNGQSEPARYTETYQAFWLNCVIVKSQSLALDCPFFASGMPSASAGAWDGTTNAEDQIKHLLRQNSSAVVQQYLDKFVSAPEVVMKFANGRLKANVRSE